MVSEASEPLFQYKKTVPNTVSKEQPYISWEAFKTKYLSREDGFKYEWLNGIVEKTKRTMDYTQFYILSNLLNKFRSFNIDGELISEGDVFFLEKHRRPDIAYFTSKQIDAAADGVNPMPEFVIEVISNTDAINRVNKKMQNYRAAEVKVVWQIFPQGEEVHIYCGDNLKTVYIKSGDEICSAEPVLPDFQLSVNDIFKRKKV